MKNILSENMLRFGVKNLSESNKKRLTLESIIQTIKEHGLSEQVRQALTEAESVSLQVNDDKFGKRIFDTSLNLVYGLTPSSDDQNTNFFVGKSSDPAQSYQTTLVGGGKIGGTQMDNLIEKIMKDTVIPVLPFETRKFIKQGGNTGNLRMSLMSALTAMVDTAQQSASTAGQ